MKNHSIGIALGSGGAKGIAHAGVLEILEKNGFIPVEIAGCSIGASIGALYASGVKIEKIKEIALNINFFQLIRLFDFTDLKKGGVIKGLLIEEFLDSLLPVKRFEDLNIPFKCVATDMIKGKEVVFSRGDLIPALRASISIPGFFIPFKYNNNIFVDGGISNPVPINLLTSLSKYKIAVMVDNYELYKTRSEKSIGIKDRINKTLEENFFSKIDSIPLIKKLHLHKKFKTIELLSRHLDMILHDLSHINLDFSKADLIIKPDVGSIPLLAFYLGKKSYKQGIRSALHALPSLIKLIS